MLAALGGSIGATAVMGCDCESSPSPLVIVKAIGIVGIALDIIALTLLIVYSNKLIQQGKITAREFAIMQSFAKIEVTFFSLGIISCLCGELKQNFCQSNTIDF